MAGMQLESRMPIVILNKATTNHLEERSTLLAIGSTLKQIVVAILHTHITHINWCGGY
jgi:hypothetical protein